MAKNTPSPAPTECWHVFDGRLIHIDPCGNVEFLTDKPCPDFQVDPRPVPHAAAYLRIAKAQAIAEAQAGDWPTTGEPDLDALVRSIEKGGA